jgi:ATP-dependent HslUV protease ATP-binding subunit HslU
MKEVTLVKEEKERLIDEWEELTPKRIVEKLDNYIVGQTAAKRAVAIALRNRIRRMRLPSDFKEEVGPKNLLLIGPTGIGKTEIARRLAQIASIPFLKVEATKFTEVGYVGRDVESMIRDLTSLTVNMVKQEASKKIEKLAERRAEERILDLIIPLYPQEFGVSSERDNLRQLLKEGKLKDKLVEVEAKETPFFEIFAATGLEQLDITFSEALSPLLPVRRKKKRVPVQEAYYIFLEEETQKLIDMDAVVREATRRVEESGIIFLDEIDKLTTQPGAPHHGPEVSREGVQRDLLPIVEGSVVTTKYRPIRTDHILFIAAGTFHYSKPSDLIPELQGRFPIRVELSSLGKEEFKAILTQPANALIKQYEALLKTEDVQLEFLPQAIDMIAELAYEVNEKTENIGARRLHTIMEKLMEDISFDAPQYKGKKITIDAAFVEKKLRDIVRDKDLSRYIL